MIYNYDTIIVKHNTLVILDIDETIIFFDEINLDWWNKMKNTYNDDYAYNSWVDIITHHKPKLLDKIEFFKLMDRIKQSNSKLILLTARNKKVANLTYQQLIHCEIPIDKQDIYFSEQKGLTTHELMQKYNYDNVIFVDDKIENINDVKEWNPEVKCYHMKHINLL